MKNVMVDVESLAVTADAVVMSVGAVEFELSGEIGRTFYASISIDSNQELGRRITEDTLVWWMRQSPDAQRVFQEAKVSLRQALEDLSSWFPEDAKAWADGTDFDLPMLAHAYSQLQMTVPWDFWNSRCVRTVRDLPGAEAVQRIKPSVAHNALEDAIAQAKTVQAIYGALFDKELVS